MGKVNQLLQDQQEAECEQYLKEHPGATPEEVWDAIVGDERDEPSTADIIASTGEAKFPDGGA